MDRDPVHPSFVGFKSAALVSHGIQLSMPNAPGFLKSFDIMICLRMYENFNFLTVAKKHLQQYDSHQPATNRKK
jgi:hypothetical protein